MRANDRTAQRILPPLRLNGENKGKCKTFRTRCCARFTSNRTRWPHALRRTLKIDSLKPEVTRLLAGWAHPAGEVLIAASGSSRHSGLAGEILLEDLCGFAVDVEYSSEYSCRGGSNLRRPAVIVISQSGETSDTLAALREVRLRGQATLAITNAASSTMAREAQVSMPLVCGH